MNNGPVEFRAAISACASMLAQIRSDACGRIFLEETGSIAEGRVTTLLKQAEGDRLTGCLELRRDGEAASLFFVLGQLVHAANGDNSGEEVVLSVMDWSSGEFSFDPKAVTPSENTVSRRLEELIVNHPQPPAAEAAEPLPDEVLATAQGPRGSLPLPDGEPVYSSLKSAFVDFRRLLATLAAERLTGYVRLSCSSSSGLLLLLDGEIIECVYDGGEVNATAASALRIINDDVSRGDGQIDVVSLNRRTVLGIQQMLMATTLYRDLYSNWVDIQALLDFLLKRRLSAAVIVQRSGEAAVALLHDGKLRGAFSRSSGKMEATAQSLIAICSRPDAQIEVRAGEVDGSGETLSLDQVLAASPGHQAQAPGSASTGSSQLHLVAEAAEAGGEQDQAPPIEQVLEELLAIVDKELANRSRKVKEIVTGAPQTRDGLLAAISQIGRVSLLFIDQSKLEALSDDLRAHLEQRLPA